jgi:predicted metalloprotease with PDZ domain
VTRRLFSIGLAASLGLCLLACAREAPGEESPGTFRLSYDLRLEPESGTAVVTLRLSQPRDLLRALDFNAPADRFDGFEGDGMVRTEADRTLWEPPSRGGTLRYRVRVDSLRGGVFEAKITPSWALFRLDDLFPPAVTRARAGVRSEATLQFSGPSGWSFETPYGPSNVDTHHITSDRVFPRPTGWALAGEIGVRRDSIAGRKVAVAAPVGEGFRRQDTLAFLRWTLPAIVEVFPGFPERLLIVSGSRDMWRGGLSGPSSIYLHTDRPLISGNGTSALIHELVHVAVANTKSDSDDWLVEGLSEYYSLEILRRTGGISERRFHDALAMLASWSSRDGGRLANPSTGPDTAHATLQLHELAHKLADRGDSLDAVVRELVSTGPINGKRLAAILEARNVPGEVFATSSAR